MGMCRENKKAATTTAYAYIAVGTKIIQKNEGESKCFHANKQKKNAATAPNNPANSMAWRRQRRRIGKQTASEKIK